MQAIEEEVVEVKRSPVVGRVRLCCWVLFKRHNLGVGQSNWWIGPWDRNRWAIVGLFRPHVAYRGFVLIAGKDSSRDWLLAGCCFRERVGCFVEAPWDVVEFEAVESVLHPSNFLTVCLHLSVVAARLLHDLVDDQLGVASDVETSDAQLDGDS